MAIGNYEENVVKELRKRLNDVGVYVVRENSGFDGFRVVNFYKNDYDALNAAFVQTLKHLRIWRSIAAVSIGAAIGVVIVLVAVVVWRGL